MLDWKNVEEYKKATKDLNLYQWRWEFLRRDPDYQQAWKDRKGVVEIDNLNVAAFDLETFIDPQISANKLKNSIKFIQRPYQLHDFKCAISKYFPKNEGERFDTEFFTTSVRSILNDKEKAVFIFDLTRPIDDQIIHVKSELLKAQESYDQYITSRIAHGKKRPRRGIETEIPLIVKNRIAPKIDHLRVLDAKAKGVKFKEIGSVIFRVSDPKEAHTRGKREHYYATQIWKIL